MPHICCRLSAWVCKERKFVCTSFMLLHVINLAIVATSRNCVCLIERSINHQICKHKVNIIIGRHLPDQLDSNQVSCNHTHCSLWIIARIEYFFFLNYLFAESRTTVLKKIIYVINGSFD